MAWSGDYGHGQIWFPFAVPAALTPVLPGPWLFSTQGGRTLHEMLVVVALLALVAGMVLPSATSTQRQRLGLAASDVADALRFAREEARRTGLAHGVEVNVSTDLLRVFRLDEGANPNLKVFDVRHPVSKQFYSIQLGTSPYSGIGIDSYGGQMVGSCDDPGNIAFDPGGVIRCIEPTATRIANAGVGISAGQFSLTVALDDYTGRVSVQ